MSRLALSALICSMAVMAFPLGAADPAVPKQRSVKTSSYPVRSVLEDRIRQNLETPTEIAFTDTPLTDAIDFLEDLHQISVIFDVAAMQENGTDPSSPVNLELSGITLRSALNLMLKPLRLTYLVEDEVLKITTLEKANESLTTRVYPVRDLADDADELESVIEAVQAGCDQTGWTTTSNKSITGVKKSRSLVIRQTQAVHDEIEALLLNLREAHADIQNPVHIDHRVN